MIMGAVGSAYVPFCSDRRNGRYRSRSGVLCLGEAGRRLNAEGVRASPLDICRSSSSDLHAFMLEIGPSGRLADLDR